MVKLIKGRLFVGGMDDFHAANLAETAILSACQTVHYRYMGWDHKNHKPDRKSPEYIVMERENLMSINWVDADDPKLFEWAGVESFIRALDFIEKWIGKKLVLVHCDKGLSRAPIVCLLYMAKRAGKISNDSYDEAGTDFIEIMPEIEPGLGIDGFVAEHWSEIK